MNERSALSRALPVLLGLGMVWGASFLFIKVVVDETGPMELVLGRLFFGMLAVGSFIAFTRRRISVNPKLLAQVSIMALLANILPFGLIAWGEEHIESGTASILNATVPIFTAAFAAAVLAEERFTTPRTIGLILAFAGVAVLTGEDVLDITDSNVLGQLACVGAAACYGLGAVFSRNMLRTQDPISLSFLQLLLGTLFSIPLLLLVTSGSPDYSLSAKAYASILALGIFGTGIGYVGYLWLIENIGSVRASLVTYIVPIVAVFLGWLALDESIGLNTIAGGALIIAGVASVMRGNVPTREPTPPPDEAEAIPALSARE